MRFTDGVVVDYTVEVTDQDGTFLVWARNFGRALQLEWTTVLNLVEGTGGGRRAAAANDNESVWREAPFCFAMELARCQI